MQQRGIVHELDGSGEIDRMPFALAEQDRRGNGQHGPEALAAAVDEIARQLGHHVDMAAGAIQDQRIDARHVIGRGGHQPLDRVHLWRFLDLGQN
ncbi:hypothetical protein D3C87_1556740 [compost metagenome]